MLARDDSNSVIQVLHPVDGSLQRLTPVIGNAMTIGTPFGPGSKVVGVRIRSATGIGHVRFGASNVAALASDFPLTIDDGWMFFSLAAKTAGNDRKPVTHVSVFAEAANVNADIVELS